MVSILKHVIYSILSDVPFLWMFLDLYNLTKHQSHICVLLRYITNIRHVYFYQMVIVKAYPYRFDDESSQFKLV